MRTIKELYNRLREQKKFSRRYPQVDENDGKIHLLYVSPCFNARGYYRMIAPALELNRTTTHAAVVSGIHKWDFNKEFEDYDSPLDERLIRWAHYVIIPVTCKDVSYIIEALKEVNFELQFVMDLDSNLHLIPTHHPCYGKISDEHKEQLLLNVSRMDVVTAPNEGLLDYYDDLLEEHYPDSEVYLEYLPNLISEFGYQEIEPLERNHSGQVRIGLVMCGAAGHDVILLVVVLKEITRKHGEKIQVIIFGWNGEMPGGDKPLEDLPVTFIKPVGFPDYFKELNELALDIALLPLADIPFNTQGKSFSLYLEFSVFAIPVVAPDIPPYNKVIVDSETGFLAASPDMWIQATSCLILDENLRTGIGKNAMKSAWRNFSYTRGNIQLLKEIFE